MYRSLLSAASVFVLLITTLLSPQVISARRCGVKLPSTLLSLYRSSDFIYIGTFDKVEEGEPTRVEEDYSVIPIKKHFSISSSLKGESQKLFVLESEEFRFKSVEESEPETEVAAADSESPAGELEAPASGEAEPETAETAEADSEGSEESYDGETVDGESPDHAPKPGDTVLLFLSKNEDEEGVEKLELTDEPDGMKKMSPESLAAYELRIRELNGIFAEKEPGYAEIVAWLVRCAEDPATRWEGTYELVRSFAQLEWQEERAKAAANRTADDEESEPMYAPRTPDKFETGDPNFAKHLSENHKLILSNILLSRRPDASPDHKAAPILGDRELIELVKRWGDSKLAATLLEQVEEDSIDSGMRAEVMTSIAQMLNDEKLIELSAAYSNLQWQAGGEEVEPDYAEAAKEAGAEEEAIDESVPDANGDSADVPTSESNPVVPEAAQEKAQGKKGITYDELRSKLVKKFLDRASGIIAKQNGEKNEN